MTNPYQGFFDLLDKTIADLDADGGVERTHKDASELLKRAGFVLGNLINAQSQVYPMLFLPADTPEPDTEDADTPSLEQPQDADSEVHSTT